MQYIYGQLPGQLIEVNIVDRPPWPDGSIPQPLPILPQNIIETPNDIWVILSLTA